MGPGAVVPGGGGPARPCPARHRGAEGGTEGRAGIRDGGGCGRGWNGREGRGWGRGALGAPSAVTAPESAGPDGRRTSGCRPCGGADPAALGTALSPTGDRVSAAPVRAFLTRGLRCGRGRKGGGRGKEPEMGSGKNVNGAGRGWRQRGGGEEGAIRPRWAPGGGESPDPARPRAAPSGGGAPRGGAPRGPPAQGERGTPPPIADDGGIPSPWRPGGNSAAIVCARGRSLSRPRGAPPPPPSGVRARRADLPGQRAGSGGCGAGREPGCGKRCGRDARGAGDSSPGAPGVSERSSAGRAPAGRAGSGCRDRLCRDSGGSEALTYSRGRGSIAAAAFGAVRAAPGFMNEPEPPPRGAGVTWGRGCPEPACTGAARTGPARTPAPPAPRPRMAAPPTGPARPAAPLSPGPELRAAPARPAAPPPPAARAGHGADPTVNTAGKQPGGARNYGSQAPSRPR